MANENPQAVRISNEKLRVLADRFGQLFNYSKALQAEYVAENWATLFPNNAELMADGSDVDGRSPVTNAEINQLMTMTNDFITWMEASTMARRNLALKIAVNPERM